MNSHWPTNDKGRLGSTELPLCDRLAVGAKDAAMMLGVGERTWWRWDSAGRTPSPFSLGGRKLWRVADLRRWAELGFPRREEFAKQSAAVMSTADPCA